jgi:hypothetical protein
MSIELEPLDCIECGAAGAVYGDFCQVCYADADGDFGPDLGPDPAGAPAVIQIDGDPMPPAPVLHPSVPPRFAHVVEELREIATQAMESGTTQGWRIASACRRAESLLFVLRRHFLNEVVFGQDTPSVAQARASR